MSLSAALLVFFGAGSGAVLRYLLGVLMPWTGGFPWATFSANILACVLVGVITGSMPALDHQGKLLLLTGFCGGLSTFSAFSRETLDLLQRGEWAIALLYVGLSVLSGLLLLGLVYAWLSRPEA